MVFAYEKSKDNPADILALARGGGLDRRRKVQMLMHVS